MYRPHSSIGMSPATQPKPELLLFRVSKSGCHVGRHSRQVSIERHDMTLHPIGTAPMAVDRAACLNEDHNAILI